MLVVLSPAKNLDLTPAPGAPAPTAPRLAKEAAALAMLAKKASAKQLAQLMDISEKLAELNRARFQAFDPAAAPETGHIAALTFAGDVYRGLDARSLAPADLRWAQDRLRILSGLYGLLRPLDAIQPYRLEMGTKLTNPKGKDLYAYWGDRLSKALDADLADHQHKTIVNLASDEYFSAVDRGALTARVVTPVFKEVKDGKARVLFLFAKRARGLMARWAVLNRLEDPAGLKDFNAEGYRFVGAEDGERLVFSRPQPPAKAAG